jgi:PEP-CTERM motif
MKAQVRSSVVALVVATAATMGWVNLAAAAGNNNAPPAGAILDLAGQAVPHGAPVTYTVDFTAALANTSLSLAFREDPAFFSVTDVTLTDLTHPSGNLLTNGDFSLGPVGSDTPVGWTFQNTFGAEDEGVVRGPGGCGGGIAGNCWFDGSVQAYDELSQTVGTTIGDVYEVSFAATDDGSLNTYSALSTNGNTTGTGGNGIDILVYAQAAPPNLNAPEPSTWAMMILGFAGMGFVAYRKAKRAPALAA